MKIKSLMLGILLCAVGTPMHAQKLKVFFTAFICNQNVYKTKSPLQVNKVYDINADTAIKKDQTKCTIKVSSRNFIRYKIIKNGDNPYIRILKGCDIILSLDNKDSLIVYTNKPDTSIQDASDYYFQTAEEKGLNPSQKYLATEHLTGMPLLMPVKIRSTNSKDWKLSTTLGYAFGTKFRINNNPFREKYINIIPFAFGLSQEKYFTVDASGKESAKEDAVAVSIAAGIMYEYYKMNFGIFIGSDRMFGNSTNWYLQGKPWISLGIGYKLGN